MNNAFCTHTGNPNWFYNNGFDGNVVKNVVGFWLRRDIDGTEPLFFDALLTLLETYDAKWLASPSY